MFEDIKNTMWKETIWVNFLRGASAGIVWMIVFLITRPPDMPIGLILSYPIGLPLGFLIIMPIISLFFKMLTSMGIPFMGWGNLVIAIMVIPGDPIMFMLHKAKPEIVPIQKYSLLTWNPFIWVVKDMIPANPASTATVSGDSACPFTGRILVDKATTVLGFNWPAQATAFTIHDDWKVKDSNGSDFGWIDVNGQIHKGLPSSSGKVDPKATLSGGDTGINIAGGSAFHGNDKFGTLVKW
ncbi:MAG: hypothetical protein ABIF87_18320 [Pseudomonadota bacterium]